MLCGTETVETVSRLSDAMTKILVVFNILKICVRDNIFFPQMFVYDRRMIYKEESTMQISPFDLTFLGLLYRP